MLLNSDQIELMIDIIFAYRNFVKDYYNQELSEPEQTLLNSLMACKSSNDFVRNYRETHPNI